MTQLDFLAKMVFFPKENEFSSTVGCIFLGDFRGAKNLEVNLSIELGFYGTPAPSKGVVKVVGWKNNFQPKFCCVVFSLS